MENPGIQGFSKLTTFMYSNNYCKNWSEFLHSQPLTQSKSVLGETGEMVSSIKRKDPLFDFVGYVNKQDTNKKVLRDVFRRGDEAFTSGPYFLLWYCRVCRPLLLHIHKSWLAQLNTTEINKVAWLKRKNFCIPQDSTWSGQLNECIREGIRNTNCGTYVFMYSCNFETAVNFRRHFDMGRVRLPVLLGSSRGLVSMERRECEHDGGREHSPAPNDPPRLHRLRRQNPRSDYPFFHTLLSKLFSKIHTTF